MINLFHRFSRRKALLNRSDGKSRRRASRPLSPFIEPLECRIAPAIGLNYGGPGTALTLTESSAGATSVTVSEVSPNDLRIDLNGAFFDPASSPAGGPLTYQTGDPATSTFADVNITAANTVATLSGNLPGDLLSLGTIHDSNGGLGNLNIAAGRVHVLVADTVDTTHATAGAGNIALSADTSVTIDPGALLLAKDGSITLNGNQGSPAAAGNFTGINDDGGVIRTTGAGNILLQGTGGNDATTGGHVGVLLADGAVVQTVGTGTLTLSGTGGQGTSDNVGVEVTGANTAVESVTGTVTITGKGGNGSGTFNVGVQIVDGGQVAGGGSPLITITGTGGQGTGNDFGVNLSDPGTAITAPSINITAVGGTALNVVSSAQVTATGVGIGLIADTMVFDSTVAITTSGRVLLSPTFNSGTPINLGGAGGGLTLTAAELNTITASDLQIGVGVPPFADGDITVNAPVAPAHVHTLELRTAHGAILEGANGLLTVPTLVLIAGRGIGVGASLRTAVSNLCFSNVVLGNVQISNSGALTLEQVDGLNPGNHAFSAATTLTTTGPLLFAADTSSSGTLTAIADEPGSPVSVANINIAPNVRLTSELGHIVLQAGDNINLAGGSTVQSMNGNVTLDIGFNTGDASSATLQGTLSGTAPRVQAGSGDAALLVDFANGASLPEGLTFAGGAGSNTLAVSDQNDATAHTFSADGNSVTRDGTTIGYTKVASGTLTGGSEADSFNITPGPGTTFTANGGAPVPPTSPGDTLHVALAGLNDPQANANFSPAAGYSGVWTFGNAKPVFFTGMETLNTADLQAAADGPTGNLFANTLAYTYSLTNKGPDAALGVTLTAALPAGVILVSASQLSGPDPFTHTASGNAVTFTAPVVAAGASDSFQLVVSVAGGTANASSIGSTVTVQSSTPDPNPGNNSATTLADLVAVVGNQLQAGRQEASQITTPAGQITALQQFLSWFSAAASLSPVGAGALVVNEMILALELVLSDVGEGLGIKLPVLQASISAEQQAIAANPLYATISGYELGLWTSALTFAYF